MLERPLPVLAWASATGDLDAQHRATFGRKFRRIGRFVKAAQLAAGRCADAAPGLDLARAGLFIGTGLGNTADIVPLAQGVLHPTRPRCSPMSFAGCLGNAASFFVARAIGCTGPNVTVSQEELSFEGALLEAAIALRAGRVSTALVGCVDVISGSEADQRARMNALEEPGDITEGAAFLVLGQGAPARAWLGEISLGHSSLERQLEAIPDGATLLPGWRVPAPPVSPGLLVAPRERRLLPVATGLRLVDVLEAGPDNAPGPLVHLQRNAAGHWGRIQIDWA